MKIDALIKEATEDPLYLALPGTQREEMINKLLETRAEMMDKRDEKFRVVDNRRIK